jgi:hypothetical protein
MNISDLNVESDPQIFEDRFARCRRLLHFLAARGSHSSDPDCEMLVRC